MNINVPDLLQALEVDERPGHGGGHVIQGECETIFRLSMGKVAPGTLGKGEFLRGYVAMDLALGVLGIPFSKTALLRKANNVRGKTYDDVYLRVRNVMGARVTPKGASIAQIAVKFRGASAERSNALLRKYQEICRSTVTADHGDRLAKRYNAPEYHAAAFCVASVQDKFKPDRKAVAAMAKLQPKDLDKICADIVAKCGPSGLEHAAKVFRVEAPGSADRGQGEAGPAGPARGKGKRPLSPRQKSRGGPPAGGEGGTEGSPLTATKTTRLDELVGGVDSPVSPRETDRLAPTGAGQGAIGRRSTEKRIDFLEGGRAAAPMAASASLSAGAADPAAPLNIFAKRLKRLESRSYEDWCRRTLGLQIL